MLLESERLTIRKFNEDDLEELTPILGDPEVMRYSLKGPLSPEEARDYLHQRILTHYHDHGYGLWALVSKETRKLIGLAGPIHQTIDGEECVEIGYRIASSEWGKGLATEGVCTISDYVISRYKMDQLIAIIEPNNTQSVRVAEKAGFILSKKTLFHGVEVGIYTLKRIVIEPYSEKWPLLYDAERSRLEEVFDGFPMKFHHIGSTSIPGCYAKPKIDILGITHDITAVDSFNRKMEKIGYTPLGEYGIKHRRFFTAKGKTPVNFHVFEDSDPETVRHLGFCDFLRHHPEKVQEYSKLKRELAERYPGNTFRYTLGKERFIKTTDYQAALKDPGKYLNAQNVSRKSVWTQDEILNAMIANMRHQMTYFAKYIPAIDIVFQPDVTVVASSIPDDTFNYVLGARFETYNVDNRVDHVLKLYREKGVPFSWWVGETDTPSNLHQVLSSKGLSVKEDDVGMYLYTSQTGADEVPADFTMRRVFDEHGLNDLAGVYAAIGGYENLFEEIYRQVPPVLIAEGSPYELYVGYLNGKPIAAGALFLHANTAGIYYVMTIPQQRGKGYGTQVMKFLIQRAKEKGYCLCTLQASADGKGLYEKLGFQPLCRFIEYSVP